MSSFIAAMVVASAPRPAPAQSTAAPAPAAAEAAEKESDSKADDRAVTRDPPPVEDIIGQMAESPDEIIVTGSRIRRSNFETASPVEIITAERAALAGLVSTAEILRGSTAASGEQFNDAFQGFITAGGPGAQQISLRGLGAQRTLVLVNGRRWSPSGVQGSTNSVDLSAIPNALWSRIEILKDGASSVYGADAVAGVINLITKEAFDGFQVGYSGFTTQRSDGTEQTVEASWGRVGERGSISIGAQYSTREQAVIGDRRWSRCDIDPRRTDQDNDGVYDNRAPYTGEPLCFGFIYGLAGTALDFLRFEPAAVPGATTNRYYDPLVNGDFGVRGYTRLPVRGLSRVSPSPAAPGSPPLDPLWDNDGPFYTDERSPSISMMVTPSKLTSLTSFGSHDLDLFGGTSQVYYEAYYNRRETRSVFGYRQFFPYVEPVTYDGAALHPYNPFAAPFAALGLLDFAGYFAVLPSYELQDPEAVIDVKRYNLFGGLKGDLTADWDYDLNVGYGHSKGTYADQQWLADRVEAAVNGIVVDPATGAVSCAPAVRAQFPGCVPADLTTADAMLRGVLPKGVLDFISKDTLGTTVYKGKSASLYLDGPLFTLPAGKAQAVLGAEWRQESIDDVPDIEAQNNNYWGYTTAGITRGTDTVKEAFVEAEAPLLRDRAYAKDLSLGVSARWSDYDSYGSDTTYRGTFRYVVDPTLTFRASIGTSFRPPDLYEQFLGDQVGFESSFLDPCNSYGTGGLRPGDPRYDNCLALGLPPNYRANASIPSSVGGASDLRAETSKSKTFGVVYKPEQVGVSFAVDYFDITINDTVASPSVGFILGECYGSKGFSSPFCSRIGPRAGANKEITLVDASYVNIGERTSVGVDTNIVYEGETERGRFTIDTMITYLIEQDQELFGETTHLAGRWGFPRWTAESQVRYTWRDYTFSWSVDFIGESKEKPVFDPGTTNIDRTFRTPNYLTHAVSLRYLADDWEITGAVRNVFDKDPPFASGGQGNEGANRFLNTLPGVGYDLLGRSFVLQVTKKFDR